MKITCGALVLTILGAGDLGELGELYAAHAAGERVQAHATINVVIDSLALCSSRGSLREPEWGVDSSTHELFLSTSQFLLIVPLAGDEPVRVRLPEWSVVVFDYALRSLIQILAPLRAESVVLHGSSVVRDGLGYAFVAQSETGKTTVARFSEELGYTVLAEEMTFVGWPSREAGPCLFSLPVIEASDLRVVRPVTVPLAAIYCLVQDTDDHIVEIPARRRPLSLAAVTFIAVREPVVMDAALAVVSKLASEIEPKTLHFTRSPRFWKTIDAARDPARDLAASSLGDGAALR